MAKFCGRCGARLDEKTGFCPTCDAEKIIQQVDKPAEPPKEVEKKPETSQQQDVPLSKKEARKKRKADKKAAKKDRKAQKKAAKKAKKKEKWVAKTVGQKVRSVLMKLLAWIFAFIVLITAAAVVLTYFGFVDIPVISSVISELIPAKREDNVGGTLYTPDENALAVDEDTGITYVNNIVIIFFNEGSSKQDVNSTIASINGEIVGSISAIDQYQVKIENKTLGELILICEKLKQNACVFDAIYDSAFEIDIETVPDDPWGKKWFSKEETWSENNPSGANWWVEAVDAPSAWEYNNKFQKIKIGIVDNGFDYGHEDLKNVIAYTSPVNNKEEHGTHVAGIVGAEANNGKGISGLVWNCELYTYDWQLSTTQNVVNSIFDMQWSTFNQILGGTVLLVEKGAKVVNLSAGQTGSMTGNSRTDSEVDYNGYYASLYLYSLLSRNYDFVVVQSAGNGNAGNTSVDAKYNGLFCSITAGNCVTGNSVSYEDVIGRIIVVGAAQNDGGNQYSQTYWSNAGARVDICAPGQDIYSTIPGGFFGSYKYLPGTSMAAPIVTGVASLVWSVNPDLSGTQVKAIVCDNQNTENVVADNNSEKHPLTNTYNLVNAKLAVEAAMRYSATSSEPSVPGTENNEHPTQNRVTSDERDIVLVLDVSGSMSGTPMAETKKASVNFIDTILDEDASIGIVTYDNSASMLSDFSVNETALTTAVSNIYDGGGTNIESGLAQARSMLSTSSAKKKIIVLMSDGEPNDGKEGDALIDYADELKDDGIIIYTLGFFESLGSYKSSAQILMEGIASDGCHYEVASADDLVFFFEDVADQINGQKYIYIRIACPVDVTVTHKGETLCSAEDDLNVRTDFGTLTFEDNENVTNANEDDRIKVLRLKEGVDYDVQIVGTGRGLMDYTIGFMDENGEYSDLRRFENIRISKTTVIDTVAGVAGKTVLNVDQDGDGKYDIRYRAEENGYGEEIKSNIMLYVGIGAGTVVLIVLIIIVHKISKIFKKKAG